MLGDIGCRLPGTASLGAQWLKHRLSWVQESCVRSGRKVSARNNVVTRHQSRDMPLLTEQGSGLVVRVL